MHYPNLQNIRIRLTYSVTKIFVVNKGKIKKKTKKEMRADHKGTETRGSGKKEEETERTQMVLRVT